MIWKQGCQAPARYCGSYVTSASPVLVPDPKLTFPSKGESVKRDIAENSGSHAGIGGDGQEGADPR
jgi:hypothetical protein